MHKIQTLAPMGSVIV